MFRGSSHCSTSPPSHKRISTTSIRTSHRGTSTEEFTITNMEYTTLLSNTTTSTQEARHKTKTQPESPLIRGIRYKAKTQPQSRLHKRDRYKAKTQSLYIRGIGTKPKLNLNHLYTRGIGTKPKQKRNYKLGDHNRPQTTLGDHNRPQTIFLTKTRSYR